MSNPYTQHTLPNGLRVVIEVMPDVRSAAAGFLVLTGARNETSELAGVSHFLEHMMFKGTAKRGWRDITIDFDRMGSTYNAYTSEEQTMFYGWVRATDIGPQIELLADMLRPALPKDEFDMERKVVLEEIAMAKDNLEHVAYDFIQEKVFAGHPLAWPVLGYERTVRDMPLERMREYFQRRYAPNNLLLVVAGHVEPSEIIDLAGRYCGDWPAADRGENPSGGTANAGAANAGADDAAHPTIHGGTDVLTVDRFNQQIVALTFPSVGAADKWTESAGAAATILGGENSRFFWDIVQKGICPRAGAYHVDYADCGLLLLFGNCQPDSAEALLDAMRTQADRVCTEKVQPHELNRVKNGRRTSIAVGAEAPYHRLTHIMDDMHYRGAPRTVEETLADVDAVTADTIHDYFQQYPINNGGHLASVGPRDWPH